VSTAPVLSVSLGLWQDRPAVEVVRTAQVADALGYAEIWIGEMATFDAFALGAIVAERTTRAALTIGPLAVAVRDPVMIAMGVALGSSSPVLVQQWHGRRQERTALALAESATAVRTLLDGGKADVAGEVIRTRGFRLRTKAPSSPLTIAAFGRGAVKVAARHADRMVINLVTPKSAARLVEMLHEECRAAGRPVPPVAAWVAAVVGPAVLGPPLAGPPLAGSPVAGSPVAGSPVAGSPVAGSPVAGSPVAGSPGLGQAGPGVEQLRRGLVAYMSAPGYGEMFAEAGFADVVRFARTGPHPGELLAAIPPEIVGHVSLVGDEADARARMAEYADAGVDEIALVPGSSDADPAGVGTLTALAPAAAPEPGSPA
jgi:alkanesulfonate monooxygenase SsuD/methylene tetrahydromethanopterin reductase-like flavin-dependent oxidoreductase (luciferase family)